MFIQTEETPNPATLKFIPGERVMSQGTKDFPSIDTTGNSSLAHKLFSITGVERVFFGSDFISITKSDTKEWYVLKPFILGVIMEHFVSSLPVMDEETQVTAHSTHKKQETDQETVEKIIELLDLRIRPMVAQDGGDIVFDHYEDGIVFLHMQGACSGCPSSTATLKSGIENMLRHYIPEVLEVQAV